MSTEEKVLQTVDREFRDIDTLESVTGYAQERDQANAYIRESKEPVSVYERAGYQFKSTI